MPNSKKMFGKSSGDIPVICFFFPEFLPFIVWRYTTFYAQNIRNNFDAVYVWKVCSLSKVWKGTLSIKHKHCIIHRFLQGYIKSINALGFTISWKYVKSEGHRFFCDASNVYDLLFSKNSQIRMVELGCGSKASCPHVEPDPEEGKWCQWEGGFLRNSSPYLREFRRKPRKTPNG